MAPKKTDEKPAEPTAELSEANDSAPAGPPELDPAEKTQAEANDTAKAAEPPLMPGTVIDAGVHMIAWQIQGKGVLVQTDAGLDFIAGVRIAAVGSKFVIR